MKMFKRRNICVRPTAIYIRFEKITSIGWLVNTKVSVLMMTGLWVTCQWGSAYWRQSAPSMVHRYDRMGVCDLRVVVLYGWESVWWVAILDTWTFFCRTPLSFGVITAATTRQFRHISLINNFVACVCWLLPSLAWVQLKAVCSCSHLSECSSFWVSNVPLGPCQCNTVASTVSFYFEKTSHHNVYVRHFTKKRQIVKEAATENRC